MPLKLSIFLPKESIDNIESLQEFITDIGDDLVAHGFGNEMVTEEPDNTYLENINSYIMISEEENIDFENLENNYLVIPINDENA